jgi:hypothetical protein
MFDMAGTTAKPKKAKTVAAAGHKTTAGKKSSKSKK